MHNITGTAYLFGSNIDTDQIYPGAYLDETEPAAIASHCLEGARKGFAAGFAQGGIIVAKTNFGCGSSREHAAIALKQLGVGAVIATSYARIFFRNGINLGLPLVRSDDIGQIAVGGDQLTIDFQSCTVKNLRTSESVPFEPISDYAMTILNAGGVKNMIHQQG